MATTPSGTTAPAGSDVYNPQADFVALANSMQSRIHIPVANAAARTALIATCGWTPTVAAPLVVYQTDTRMLWSYDGTNWTNTPLRQSILVGTGSGALGSSPTFGAAGLSTVTAPANMWSSGTPSRIIAPYDGTMFISVSINWTTLAASERYLGIRVNGATDIVMVSGNLTASSTFGAGQSGSTGVVLTAGQYVEVMLAQTSGASITPAWRVYARLD